MSEALIVELPDALSADVRRVADARGLTPAQYLAELALLHAGGEDGARAWLAARALRADWDAYERVFGRDRQSGEPPGPDDRLD